VHVASVASERPGEVLGVAGGFTTEIAHLTFIDGGNAPPSPSADDRPLGLSSAGPIRRGNVVLLERYSSPLRRGAADGKGIEHPEP